MKRRQIGRYFEVVRGWPNEKPELRFRTPNEDAGFLKLKLGDEESGRDHWNWKLGCIMPRVFQTLKREKGDRHGRPSREGSFDAKGVSWS
jgi:hypothetical protein